MTDVEEAWLREVELLRLCHREVYGLTDAMQKSPHTHTRFSSSSAEERVRFVYYEGGRQSKDYKNMS